MHLACAADIHYRPRNTGVLKVQIGAVFDIDNLYLECVQACLITFQVVHCKAEQ